MGKTKQQKVKDFLINNGVIIVMVEYFRKMHQLFPKCKKMLMAVRNQIASSFSAEI